MNWGTRPEADADLVRGREWIEADNPEAGQEFLRTARDCFERLGQFPELGAEARIQGKEFSAVRFLVLDPPFNRWIVFYRVTELVEIVRVLYGTQNWRQAPRRFF